ncbi:MAG: ATP-binding protein, partial [Holophagales bacterium]|nr:ATP-binding protein [Holophagales bacterium]
EGDDIELLVQTFEKALEALSTPSRPKVEAAGDEMRALESALAESLESGVVLCDREGAMLALNSVAANILEVEEPEPGIPAAEVLDGHPELLELVRRAVAEQVPIRREECRIRTSRGQRTLGLTAHPLRRDTGEVRGHLLLFADLTEVQRRLEEERLSENLEQLGELSAGVAHEMRNGLATLGGYLTLIDRARGGDAVQGYLAEIRSETQHLHRVLEDFLAFARPGSARLETVSLGGIVHRVAQDPAFADVEVRVEIDLPAGATGETRGDRALLSRALTNLLHNAAAAQRENGCAEPIEVRFTSSAEPLAEMGDSRSADDPTEGSGVEATYLRVSILDRGSGLPPHLRERLGEPFVTGRTDGVGLGLALARRILLLHRGSLNLRDREGGGAVAEVSLPAGKIVT